jgi:hypothetical protein
MLAVSPIWTFQGKEMGKSVR